MSPVVEKVNDRRFPAFHFNMTTPRHSTGQYPPVMDENAPKTLVSSIIHDELERFWENTRSRLNDVSQLDDETAQQVYSAQSDLKKAISQHFGDPVARSC